MRAQVCSVTWRCWGNCLTVYKEKHWDPGLKLHNRLNSKWINKSNIKGWNKVTVENTGKCLYTLRVGQDFPNMPWKADTRQETTAAVNTHSGESQKQQENKTKPRHARAARTTARPRAVSRAGAARLPLEGLVKVKLTGEQSPGQRKRENHAAPCWAGAPGSWGHICTSVLTASKLSLNKVGKFENLPKTIISWISWDVF